MGIKLRFTTHSIAGRNLSDRDFLNSRGFLYVAQGYCLIEVGMIDRETMNDPLPHITLDKELRRDIDAIIQRLKTAIYHPMPNTASFPPEASREDIERAVAEMDAMAANHRFSEERLESLKNLKLAVMWLGMDLKAINDENPGAIDNPYPSSKDPSTGAKIEPTADGLKL